MIKKLELDDADHRILIKYCAKREIKLDSLFEENIKNMIQILEIQMKSKQQFLMTNYQEREFLSHFQH